MTWTSGEPALRELWGLDPAITFLNHGSFGAAPGSVLKAQARWRREIEREPVEFFMRRLPALLQATREKLGRFVGADPAGMVFVPNASAGVSTVLRSLDFDSGDEIVVTDHGYQGVKNAVLYTADRFGPRVAIARVPFPLQSAEQVVSAIARELNGRTKLLIVDHVTSPTALIFPVAQIVALAHERGVPVFIDGAHAPGMLPLEVDAIGADFYTGNLHKWLSAPKGAAFLCVAPVWRERIHPLTMSHGYQQGLHREFDWTGTQDPSAVLAIGAAIDHWISLGVDDVRASNHALVQSGRALVARALKVDLPHPDDPALYGSMAAIHVPHAEKASSELCARLRNRMFEEHKIEVPFTWFDERVWVRPSAQVYNRPEDYARLAHALESGPL